MSDLTLYEQRLDELFAPWLDENRYNSSIRELRDQSSARGLGASTITQDQLTHAALADLQSAGDALEEAFGSLTEADVMLPRSDWQQLRNSMLTKLETLAAALKAAIHITDLDKGSADYFADVFTRGAARIRSQLDAASWLAIQKRVAADKRESRATWRSFRFALLSSGVTIALSAIVTLFIVNAHNERYDQVRRREDRAFAERTALLREWSDAIDSSIANAGHLITAANVSPSRIARADQDGIHHFLRRCSANVLLTRERFLLAFDSAVYDAFVHHCNQVAHLDGQGVARTDPKYPDSLLVDHAAMLRLTTAADSVQSSAARLITAMNLSR